MRARAPSRRSSRPGRGAKRVRRRGDRAHTLRDDVGRHLAARKATDRPEPECDRGIDVRAPDVTGSLRRPTSRRAERERHASRAECVRRCRDHHGARADRDENERADELRRIAAASFARPGSCRGRRPCRPYAGYSANSSGRSLRRIASAARSTSYSTRTNSTSTRRSRRRRRRRSPRASRRPSVARRFPCSRNERRSTIAMPRLVRVAEGDQSPARAPAASAIFVQNASGRSSVQYVTLLSGVPWTSVQRRAGDVPAERAQVDSKWQRAEQRFRFGRHVRSGPRVAHVRQLFLPRILVAAAAVLVVGRDRRVVVAGDARDPRLAQPLDDLVRPRRVADEITEVIGRIDVSPRRCRRAPRRAREDSRGCRR